MQHSLFNRRDFLNHTKKLSYLMGLGAIQPSLSSAQALYNPNLTQLTQFNVGNLPLILIAPHGGTEFVYGAPPRRNLLRPVTNFSYYGAVWTREITMQVMRTITRLSGGKKPYLVVNLAHRRYVDVNREESNAYEGLSNAARIYWEYHEQIESFVQQMHARYPNPLLLEISGQKNNPHLIVRRTLNGQTILPLRQKHGEEAFAKKLRQFRYDYHNGRTSDIRQAAKRNYLNYRRTKEEKILEFGKEVFTGEHSIMGELKLRGYRIQPDLYEIDNEQTLTTAGDYSLQHYGLRDIHQINAMQIVIGSDLRRTSNFQQTGLDLGNAIWAFMEKYIL